jgi:hypothetical protein
MPLNVLSHKSDIDLKRSLMTAPVGRESYFSNW